MSTLTNTTRLIRSLPAIFALALGGCVVAPPDPYYGYREETIIVAPSHRAEYRTYAPSAGYFWIDSYRHRAEQRRDWSGERWAPPPVRQRAPERRWERDHDHERSSVRERDRSTVRDRDISTVRDRSRQQNWQQLQQQPDADNSRSTRTFRERRTADASEQTRDPSERRKWRERSRERDDDEGDDNGRQRRGSSGWRNDAR